MPEMWNNFCRKLDPHTFWEKETASTWTNLISVLVEKQYDLLENEDSCLFKQRFNPFCDLQFLWGEKISIAK